MFITYSHAADLLGVPIGTLHYWVHKGFVPFYRISPRKVLFDREELERWVKERRGLAPRAADR
ncbi:MAG: helix-turn-helix domain-containing protein [Myxococcota bacterium]